MYRYSKYKVEESWSRNRRIEIYFLIHDEVGAGIYFFIFGGVGVYLVLFGGVGAGVYNFLIPGAEVYFILATPQPYQSQKASVHHDFF